MKLFIPNRSLYDWGIELLCAIALTCVIYPLFFYIDFSDIKWPVHYNLNGDVNSWGTRLNMWFLPIMSLLMYGGFTLLEKRSSEFNYPFMEVVKTEKINKIGERGVRWLKFFIIGLFGYLNLSSLWIATDQISMLNVSYLFIIFGMMVLSGIFWLCFIYFSHYLNRV